MADKRDDISKLPHPFVKGCDPLIPTLSICEFEPVVKLAVMLLTFLLLALAMLGLRQHRLEVTSQTVHIHDEIVARRQLLLDQRVAIARETNPWALAAGLKSAGMDAGAAMVSKPMKGARPGTIGTPTSPTVEKDLVEPLLNDADDTTPANETAYTNPHRPRG